MEKENIPQFAEKSPREIAVLTFDFDGGLDDDEIVTGVVNLEVIDDTGRDIYPDSILEGHMSIDESATQVQLSVTGGIADSDYRIGMTVSTSNPYKYIGFEALLPIRS